jgi:hypothetical protein
MEIELGFEVDQEGLSVSQRWRSPEETYTTYALKFYWGGDRTSTTQDGDWEALLRSVDLRNL